MSLKMAKGRMFGTQGLQLLRNWKFFILIGAPILLSPVLFIEDNDLILPSRVGDSPRPSTKFKCAYVLLLMATYWITDAMPLTITCLIPVALFPLLSIQDTADVTINYLRESTMMFMIGLIIATAVEYSNLHQRIALRVMSLIGTSPASIMFGLMLTTMFLSMWVSNTATCAMMIPICLAILKELSNETHQGNGHQQQGMKEAEMEKMFLLSICYSSNIGGTGVVTGTSPNLILLQLLQPLNFDQDGKYLSLNYSTWMAFNIPGTILNTFIAWLYMTLVFIILPTARRNRRRRPKSDHEGGAGKDKGISNTLKEMLNEKYKSLGGMSWHEFVVAILFFAFIMICMFRDPRIIKGWSEYIPYVEVGDSTGAMLIVLALFIIPKSPTAFTGGPRDAALDWAYVQSHLPWGAFLLNGGGMALADGAAVSGLSTWIGEQLVGLAGLDEKLILLIVMVLTALLTEIASNPATANIIIPILLSLSRTLNLHPLYLTLPATVSCSYSFMLPVGGPPNAIVYGAANGRLSIAQMAKTGAFMNLSCILILFLLNISYGNLLFNYSGYEYANSTVVPEAW